MEEFNNIFHMELRFACEFVNLLELDKKTMKLYILYEIKVQYLTNRTS